MSSNISKALAAVSDVSVTVHMDRLTKGQRASVARQVERGVVSGTGVTAVIAHHFLEQYKLPYVRMRYWGYLDFKRVPLDQSHPLREALITAHATTVMVNPEQAARAEKRPYGGKPSEVVRNEVDSGRYLVEFNKHARDNTFKNVSCKNQVEIPEVFALPVK